MGLLLLVVTYEREEQKYSLFIAFSCVLGIILYYIVLSAALLLNKF